MGIYIPNVQKPKKCIECPCYYYEYKECNAIGSMRVDGKATPPTDCQAIEVKPHGRLIDADHLKACIPELSQHWAENCRYCELWDEYQIKEQIDADPTIIEAEGET